MSRLQGQAETMAEVASRSSTERPAAVWLVLALKGLAVVGLLQSVALMTDNSVRLPAVFGSIAERNPWWSWWVTGVLALVDLFGAITLVMLSRTALYIFAPVFGLHVAETLLLFTLQTPTGVLRWFWLSTLAVGFTLKAAIVGYTWWLCGRGILK